MASDDTIIAGLPVENVRKRARTAKPYFGVHPAISELFFNTHHDFNIKNPDAKNNKGYFNLKYEAQDFLASLNELNVKVAKHVTPEMLIKDFLPRL